ncbi:unnamed protein product [Closterium sp. Yama58-4]|nr:unnamed protein product [Closterium sp. Yama58-4]
MLSFSPTTNLAYRDREAIMKDALKKTKVVVRKLPPNLKEEAFVEALNKKYQGRYNWVMFYPGKSSAKKAALSRAYINFFTPDDVLAFSSDFHGHTFVNEKGQQFQATVEYAPWQKVPREAQRKDPRQGTIEKDPDYVAFLAALEQGEESLPSAEVQLEKADAAKAAAAGVKEPLVLTPLVEYVCQRRANARAGPQARVGEGRFSCCFFCSTFTLVAPSRG